MDDLVLPSNENFSNEETGISSSMEIESEYSSNDETLFSDDENDCSSTDETSFFDDIEAIPAAPMINKCLNILLPELPAKSLIRLKSVSPTFERHISNPFIIHSHALLAKCVSGLFYHLDINGSPCPCYVSFDESSPDLPDLSLSFMPEKVTIKATTRGMLCLHGCEGYYVANPVTREYVKLPKPSVQHGDNVAVVFLFEEPFVYNFEADYQVVCAFRVIEEVGAYMFETFSSSTWEWTMSSESEIYSVLNVVPASGVTVGGLAYWHTTMQKILEYNPKTDIVRNLDLPSNANYLETQYELGEMEGNLSITSKSSYGEVIVQVMEEINGIVSWRQIGTFWISGRNYAAGSTILRSQGKAGLVIWEVEGENTKGLVLRNVNGAELTRVNGPGRCADFLPFIATLVPVKRSGAADIVAQQASPNTEAIMKTED